MQFVIVSPNSSNRQKRRPRLVTSCDNCRSRKIKCVQISDSKCEACEQAEISCHYGDRERFYAGVSGGGVKKRTGSRRQSPTHEVGASRSRASSTSTPSSSSPSPRLSQTPAQLSSPATSSDSLQPVSGDLMYHSLLSSMPGSGFSLEGCSPPTPGTPLPDFSADWLSFGLDQQLSPSFTAPDQSGRVLLFDPEQPRFPHKSLMPYFIGVFLQKMGSQYPFMTYQNTLDRYNLGELPPLLCNCLAALAVRYCDLPDLINRGLDGIAQQYLERAKNIFSVIMSKPAPDTLYALLLLSWAEHRHGRVSDFRTYSQMAMRMAMDLGLSKASDVASPTDPTRVTWSSVVQLETFATASGSSSAHFAIPPSLIMVHFLSGIHY
ncbi:hypothetical protein CONPUDRAFT_83130 [Coniophora puteana RWD-64-598 SS2]|uniref:Zn(2)-C6 fungal-type domain-containing protein n=1 Tax=Coniophora puteana (strain RWD-64-598) TaxID=741705 RepID=A0A5M3MLE4_CONPW|nr:uncharacterized protein CONPUDRAFT_83130 [Coniophora puteana RWD-64-598 SS2]EIW79876.1 hypothetical protein CONPUDRAFT_83130 [Coniophora puteana RWD-64-598 SS2]